MPAGPPTSLTPPLLRHRHPATLACILLLCLSSGAQAEPFSRPSLHTVPHANVSGAYAGAWSVSEGGADVTLLQRLLPAVSFSVTPYEAEGDQRKANTAHPPPQSTQPATATPQHHSLTPDAPGRRVVEFRTVALDSREGLVKGVMALRDGMLLNSLPELGETGAPVAKRLYHFRGAMSGGNLALIAIPSGLQGLAANEYLPEDRIVHSFLAASFSVERFARHSTLSVSLASGDAYVMPEDGTVRSEKPPDMQSSDVFSAVHSALGRDPCIWFGDLRVATASGGGGVGAEWVGRHSFEGSLVSLTCNATVKVQAGQAEVAAETDWTQAYLMGGGVVTAMQVVGFVRQGRLAPSPLTHSRMSWLSFLNIGVLEWAMFGAHFSLLSTMPALLRCVLGLSMLHWIILHLCTQYVLNAILANSFFSDCFSKCWILSTNIAWWAVDARVPYLWIPSLLLLHSMWLPQIYHSACVNAVKPIEPSLLIATLVARLYYVGCELLHDSLLITYAPRPLVFWVLSAWLIAQTAVMLLQHHYGPTIVVPEKWFSARKLDHNYHRQLPPHLARRTAADPVTPLTSPGVRDARRRVGAATGGAQQEEESLRDTVIVMHEDGPDCVICQTRIDLDSPLNYMIPPCDHIFHNECLLQWMHQRMECPICRRELPAP